jgi:hypothetical protein
MLVLNWSDNLQGKPMGSGFRSNLITCEILPAMHHFHGAIKSVQKSTITAAHWHIEHYWSILNPNHTISHVFFGMELGTTKEMNLASLVSTSGPKNPPRCCGFARWLSSAACQLVNDRVGCRTLYWYCTISSLKGSGPPLFLQGWDKGQKAVSYRVDFDIFW